MRFQGFVGLCKVLLLGGLWVSGFRIELRIRTWVQAFCLFIFKVASMASLRFTFKVAIQRALCICIGQCGSTIIAMVSSDTQHRISGSLTEQKT